MRVRSRIAVVGAVIGVLLGVTALPAAATNWHPMRPHTIRVHPGTGTISAAVAAASPGDTLVLDPGMFFDSVTVTIPLTIRGSGWASTVVKPSATSNVPCGFDGFCAVGVVDQQGNPDFSQPVHNVTIENLRVTGFSAGIGVDGFNTEGYHVRKVRADHNGAYGIARFASTNSVFENNWVSFNGEAGLYMGDSPHANSILRNNWADHNGFGLFMRDSTDLTAIGNNVWANCVGILALNTGEGAPWDLPAGDYHIAGNISRDNNAACPADDGPPTSGIGIALAGVHDTNVTANLVANNKPTGPSLASGGIVLISTAAEGGTDPTNNLVAFNVALRNQPADIVSDGTGSGNRIRGNICRLTMPSNLGGCFG